MPPGADALAQARALLNTLRTLAAQHEMVLAAYERQLDIISSGGGGGGGGGGAKISKAPANKRPLLPGLPPGADLDGPEAKKARLVAEQQARRNALWHECFRVLERCRRNAKAEAFKKPVDHVRLKIFDYPNVVKEPMDLQTVGEKLKLRVYKDPGQFAYDMRLIWANAELYNGKVHPVGQAAIAMSEFFEKAWGPLQVEKQWAIAMQQEQLAQQGGGGGASGDLAHALRDKRDMLGHFIAARDFQEGLPPGALGPLEPGRSMGFEERRKLSAHLASLPGEKMGRVLDIVAAGVPIPEAADPEAEIELDIEALPDAVLWQLKEYVDSVLAPTNAPPKKAGAAAKGAAASKSAPGKAGGPAAKAASGTPGAAGGAGAATPGGSGVVPAAKAGSPQLPGFGGTPSEGGGVLGAGSPALLPSDGPMPSGGLALDSAGGGDVKPDLLGATTSDGGMLAPPVAKGPAAVAANGGGEAEGPAAAAAAAGVKQEPAAGAAAADGAGEGAQEQPAAEGAAAAAPADGGAAKAGAGEAAAAAAAAEGGAPAAAAAPEQQQQAAAGGGGSEEPAPAAEAAGQQAAQPPAEGAAPAADAAAGDAAAAAAAGADGDTPMAEAADAAP